MLRAARGSAVGEIVEVVRGVPVRAGGEVVGAVASSNADVNRPARDRHVVRRRISTDVADGLRLAMGPTATAQTGDIAVAVLLAARHLQGHS